MSADKGMYAITHPEFLCKRKLGDVVPLSWFEQLEQEPAWRSVRDVFENLFGRGPTRSEAMYTQRRMRARSYTAHREGNAVYYFVAPSGTPAAPFVLSSR